MKHITVRELLALFDPAVHDKIKAAAKRMQASHIVVAHNLQMDSSQFGHRTALCVGPACTYHTPAECEGKYLNDLPSQRMYFKEYADVPAEWRIQDEL